MERHYYVYGLYDPRDERLRYVGMTNNFKYRLTRHLTDAKKLKKFPVHKWIYELLELGIRPKMKVIEIVNEIQRTYKEDEWIYYYNNKGNCLLNVTPGRYGNRGERIAWNKGKSMSDDEKKKRSATMKGMKRTKEEGEKIAKRTRGSKRANGFSSSKFSGICKEKGKNLWVLQFYCDKVRVFTKRFKSEICAAKKYNELALKYYGPDAKLNVFTEEEEERYLSDLKEIGKRRKKGEEK